MNRITIKARLLFLFLFVSILLILIGVIGLRNAAHSNAALETVYKDRVVCLRQLKIISDMYAVNIVDTAHKTRNGNITTSEALNRIQNANHTIQRQWNAYMKTFLTPQEKRLIEELSPLMQNTNQSLGKLHGFLRTENREGIAQYTIHDLYPAIDPVTAKISQLIDLQLNVAKAQYEKAIAEYEKARRSAIVAIAGGIILISLICFALMRSVSKPIRQVQTKLQELASGEADLSGRLPVKSFDEVGQLSRGFNTFMDKLAGIVKQVQTSGIHVNSSSTSIGAFTRELETAVNQQVTSSVEVVATAAQISATSQELANTMNDVAAMLQRTIEFASGGHQSLERMELAIRQMEDATESVAARLGIIKERAQSINSVVTAISKVAAQTNLLSFNAAIAAEKAGEHGQGFSVVAEEIRRLSDQTEVAALEIGKMVKEMTSAVSSGVSGMDQFTNQVASSVEEVRNVSALLSQIIEKVESLAPRFAAVTEGMQSQSIAAEQIKEAMVELRDAAHRTSESLTESSRMVEQLNRASQGLHREVGRFKVN
jgi:methyl-accepting chemotaxis protein